MKKNEVKLSSGAIVRVEPASPLAYTVIMADMPECQMPPPPVEIITGKTRGTTQVAARPGTPEYDEYQKAVDKVRRAQDRMKIDVFYALSVVAWKLPGQKAFTDEVPADWKIPERLTRAGLEPHQGPDGRRWDFILYGLIQVTDDMTAIDGVFPKTAPLTEAEVGSASDTFRDNP